MVPVGIGHQRCTADTKVPAVREKDNLASMVS